MTTGDAALVALRSAALRRYLAGQLQSVTASWIQVVALSWVLVERHPTALGWVVALQFGPSLVLGPWFGPLIDRHDRRRVLIVAEAGLGLVAAGYAVAAVTNHLTLPLILVLATAWGILNALDTPARQALVPALVRSDQAARAAAMSGVVVLVSMTAGSALGAIVVDVAGVAVAFLVNSVSFGLDVMILSTIAVVAPARALVGAGLTAVTAGGIVGAIVAAVRRAPTPHSLGRGCAGMAVSLATVAVSPGMLVALAGLVGVGLAWSLLLTSAIAHLPTAERAMMGRVMSWLAVVLVGGTAVGGPLTSTVISSAGPRAPFVLGAVAALLAIAILRWRGRVDDLHSAVVPANGQRASQYPQ